MCGKTHFTGRWFVLSLALLGASLALAACGGGSSSSTDSSTDAASTSNESTETSASEPETVKVALFTDYPPASFIENGKTEGWMPELLEPLEEETNLHFDTTNVRNFETFIPGLQSGRFDIAAANITVSDERIEAVDMVTIDSVGTGFVAPAGSGVKVSESLDVCGKTVSALSGSIFLPQLEQINSECKEAGKPSADVQVFPESSAAALAATTGRVELFMSAYSELAYSAEHTPKLELQPYQFARFPEAIAFPKGSPYPERFQEAINNLIKSGVYAEALDKWGVSAIAIEESEINPEVSEEP